MVSYYKILLLKFIMYDVQYTSYIIRRTSYVYNHNNVLALFNYCSIYSYTLHCSVVRSWSSYWPWQNVLVEEGEGDMVYEWKRERVCVCIWVRECVRESVFKRERVIVWESMRESAWEKECERECEWECVREREYVRESVWERVWKIVCERECERESAWERENGVTTKINTQLTNNKSYSLAHA